MQSNEKKIVHICLNSLFTDGWTYQDQMLSKYHKKLGYDVSVITSHWINDDKGKIVWDERDNYINLDGIKVKRLNMIGKDNFHRKLKKFKGFYDCLVLEKPDIIFIHNISFVDIARVVKYAKKHSDTIIYADNHTDFSNSAKNWISKVILHQIIWRHYAKKISPFVRKFYGVLPSRVQFLTDIYKTPKEKTELLVMGADDDEVEEALTESNRLEIRDKYGIANDDILLITGGKIDIHKKQTITLMQAVNKIDNPKIKLLVFGSVVDELRESMMAQCTERCKYIGWIDSADTLKYYGASDLVVFPGRHSVFWEQVVAIGKPMICKYWEGTTHVDVGGNVKFLYDDSIEGLEKTINSVLNTPNQLNEMTEIAIKNGKKKFYYSQIAKRSLELI